jgi:CheY-like chemotaxis protein
MAHETAEILLVEDSEGDIRLTQEALREAKIQVNLSVARDGEEAMSFLLRRAGYINAPRPDLILLDLNMPRLGGREVLAAIKSNDDLKSIPVVILTTSEAQRDILATYGLHANCYITKPVDLEQFMRVIHHIEDFWLSLVKLPSRRPLTR